MLTAQGWIQWPAVASTEMAHLYAKPAAPCHAFIVVLSLAHRRYETATALAPTIALLPMLAPVVNAVDVRGLMHAHRAARVLFSLCSNQRIPSAISFFVFQKCVTEL